MYYQQQPTFWDGLANGLLSGLEKKMEAKQNADAWNQIANFSDTLKSLDTGGQTHLRYNGTNQPGTNVQNKATSGLFGSMIGAQPTSQDLWQGGLLGKAGMPQQPNFIQPQAAPTIDQTNQFNNDLQQHPEWFRNGITQGSKVYIGDNQDIANNAIVNDKGEVTDRTQQSTAATPNYQLKNDFLPDNVTKTVSAPKSLTEIKSMVRSQIPLAAKELAKRGHNPKDFMPFLLQLTNDKIAEHTDQFNQQQQEQALSVLGSDADYKTKMIAGIRAGMKPDMLKLALDSGMTFHNLNLTDRQQPIAYDKHNNKVINLLTGQPITGEELQNGVSPTAVYNKNTVSADNIYNKNTVSADTQYRVANRPSPRGGYSAPKAAKVQGNSGSVYNANQIYQAKQIAQEYYRKVEDGTIQIATPAEQDKYNKAAMILNDAGQNAY